MTEDLPQWDEYAHVYIMGLRDWIDQAPKSEFTDPKLQRIYNYGRFVGDGQWTRHPHRPEPD